MPAMTEKQVLNACEILAKLYAKSKGFENPVITLTRKETKEDKEVKEDG